MIYQFNNIELNTANFLLLVDGIEKAVEPQIFNLIQYLVVHKDRIISRDELLDKIWQNRVVSETSINNSIKTARKILGDDGQKQNVIKTIHSRGYQFIASMNTEPTTQMQLHKYKNMMRYASVFLVVILLVFLNLEYNKKYELKESINKIANFQEMAYITFVAQAKRRDELVDMIENRLGIEQDQQFENFFALYFDKLNKQEMFIFNQIRAMTETGLYQNNLKIVDELNRNPQIYALIPGTNQLKQHLEFWLNKYHSVFKSRKDMSLLYVGVEDGVPYPSEVNNNIKAWLNNEH